ncbi:MAG: hypothetical protein HQL88_09920 [Magnetococcales bacterium]|nr:hypothetical protein [Magnetococcales bacterium]
METQWIQPGQSPSCVPELPRSLVEMVETIGMEDTMRIVKEFGGTRIFVPKRVAAQHKLADFLGLEQARRLSRHYGGENVSIPRMTMATLAKRNREIIRRYDAGDSASLLARVYKMTERRIRAILNTTP